MLFAYLGPDTVLPLTSVVAAVAGAVMMFGRGILGAVRRLPGRGASATPTAAGPSRRGDVLRRGPAAGGPGAVGAPHQPASPRRESESSNVS